MQNYLRKTGIDILGDVPWATHFCQFYQTKQDLIDTLVPYFKAGLENNEFCMWVTAEPLTAEEARKAISKAVPGFSKYLKKRQIEILPYTEWYTRGGSFDSQRVLNGWVERLESALARGYDGLRLTGNTFWLEKRDWPSFTDYEAAINNVIGKFKMLALCTYCLDKCNAVEIIDVIRNHEFALIKQEGKWKLVENSTYKSTKQALTKLVAEVQAQKEELATTNEKLSVQEAELSAILESAPMLMLMLDQERRVIKTNKAAADFAGRTVEGMIGLRAGEALRCLRSLDDPLGCGFGPSCGSCVTRLTVMDTIDTGKSHNQVECKFHPVQKGKPEELTLLLFTVRPDLPEKRTLICIQDITERKQAEEEVIRINQSLMQQKTELESVNKELESFSYSVSHDLRAPLRSMDGFSQALIEDYADKLDDRGKDYLWRIRRASQTMSQLIDDMLKLSRVTRADMNYDKINLSDLVESIAERYKASQPERQVEFKIAPDIAAHGDLPLLRIAIQNLLENAWKFTAKCPKAKIEFGVTDLDDKKMFFIKDNGVGFDMAYADKLFTPFQRLHSNKEYPGTGIGLATVGRIIRRHGGQIRAESKINQGTTFYFTL